MVHCTASTRSCGGFSVLREGPAIEILVTLADSEVKGPLYITLVRIGEAK